MNTSGTKMKQKILETKKERSCCDEKIHGVIDLNISIIIFNGLYSDRNNLNLLQLQYEYFLHNNEAENLGDQKGQMARP
jgi:hypothetical protein